MTRAQQKQGDVGQGVAALALSLAGVLQVEKIGTPVRLIPVPSARPNVYQVIFGEKVSGDHRGILPGGRSVLAETKTHDEPTLPWSMLRPHQPERLTAHHDAGGLSLLVWVHCDTAYILRWPVPGFGPRGSIALDYAKRAALQDAISA